MEFFKQCWDIINEDLVAAIQNFHKKYFEKSLNATYVALIPNKVETEELKDFKPISLIGGGVGGFYKIITKHLAKTQKSNPRHSRQATDGLHQKKAGSWML